MTHPGGGSGGGSDGGTTGPGRPSRQPRRTQLDILTAIVDQLPPAPAIRRQRSLGPRPPWSRFWEKVDRRSPDGCWIWTASLCHNGYGQFTVLGQPIKTHRWAYQNLVGRVPEGMQLDHLCRNRACVNPWHLEPVTPRENTMRGETLAAANAAKTHCKSGHPFDTGNTRITPKGYRVCRTCHAIAENRRRSTLAVAR